MTASIVEDGMARVLQAWRQIEFASRRLVNCVTLYQHSTSSPVTTITCSSAVLEVISTEPGGTCDTSGLYSVYITM